MSRGGNSNKSSQGARPKFSQRRRLSTHNLTYNLDSVINNLRLLMLKRGLNSFMREATKRSREESRGWGFQAKIFNSILNNIL